MDVSYIGVSPFYTGSTNQLRFVTVPMTFDKNYFLISVITSCSVGLSPTFPDEWYIIEQLENTSATGTTFILGYQPTTSITNPTWEVSGLSTNLNGGYVLLFSGCTKNQNKIFNYDQHLANNNTMSSGNMIATKNNSLGLRVICLFGNVSITAWNSSPSITWTEICEGSKTKLTYSITIGISIHENIDTKNYSLSNSLSDNPPKNNVHNLSITEKPTNVNLMVNF